MTSLLDRYVEAIRRRLPRRERDDIAAELRANLLSQIEGEEAERGRPLAEDDVAAILQRYGAPEVVAARYGGRDHLIGPTAYPHYVASLKITLWISLLLAGLWIVGAAALADGPADVARAAGGALLIVGATVVLVTAMFAWFERVKGLVPPDTSWDPRALRPLRPPAALPESVPRRASAVSMAMTLFWLLWWVDVLPINRWLFDGRVPFAPAPVWDALTPLIVGLMAFGMVVNAMAIARPRWIHLHEAGHVLVGLGMLVVLLRALAAPELIVTTAASGGLVALKGLAHAGLTVVLAILAVITVLSVMFEIHRLVVRARRRGEETLAADWQA